MDTERRNLRRLFNSLPIELQDKVLEDGLERARRDQSKPRFHEDIQVVVEELRKKYDAFGEMEARSAESEEPRRRGAGGGHRCAAASRL